MNCKKCGTLMPENAKFCQYCGAQNDINVMTINNNPMMSQPVNNDAMNQPMMNQTMNNVPLQPNKGSSNPLLFIILIIVGICAIAIPIVMVMIKGNTREVEFNGYTFHIDKSYVDSIEDNSLAIRPANEDWFILFQTTAANYDELKTQIDSLDIIMGAQYEGSTTELKSYKGKEYILTTVNEQGIDMEILYTDLGNNEVLLTLLMPIDDSITFDELLDKAFPIIESVEKN